MGSLSFLQNAGGGACIARPPKRHTQAFPIIEETPGGVNKPHGKAKDFRVELQYILDRGKKRVRLERPSGIVELQHN